MIAFYADQARELRAEGAIGYEVAEILRRAGESEVEDLALDLSEGPLDDAISGMSPASVRQALKVARSLVERLEDDGDYQLAAATDLLRERLADEWAERALTN